MANQRDLLVRFLGDSKGLTRAAKDAISSLDDTASASDKVAAALSAMAEDMRAEMKGATGAADALASAMGDELVAEIKAAGGSVDRFVSDLHRAGLTYDEIIAGSDQLATSIKEVGDAAKLMGGEVEDGAKRADDGLRKVHDSGDQSRSVFANLVGNSAQDLGELGGVAGTAGVALGQLAEYAADGNIKLSNLVAFAGPMAVVGLAVAGIASHAADLKKIDAFRTERVEAFAKALLEAKSDAEALNEVLASGDQRITFINTSGEVEDLTQLLADARMTADDFFKKLEMPPAEFAKWAGEAFGAGDKLNTVLNAGRQIREDLAKADLEAAATAYVYGKATDEVADSANDATDAVNELNDAISDLQDRLSDRSAVLDMQDSLDQLKWKLASGELSAREQEQAILDLQLQYAGFIAEAEGIPDEIKTELSAQIDDQAFDVVQSKIDQLTRNRIVKIGGQWVGSGLRNDMEGRDAPWPGGADGKTSTPWPMAEGGIVMPRPGGTPAILGEAGRPEAVIPLDRAGRIGGMGGSYSITVNAGMGSDGGDIGRQVVAAIKDYEARSGKGWRS